MEKVFGRHKATIKSISGIYSSKAFNDELFSEDYDFLYKEGIAGIFGTGTLIPEATIRILKKIFHNDNGISRKIK